MMDSKKNVQVEDRLERAIEGGAVSRRWLLKNTANVAAGTLAVSALGATAAEPKPAVAPQKASSQHDPHANNLQAHNAAAFEGWESV
jgi:hypothetical protein